MSKKVRFPVGGYRGLGWDVEVEIRLSEYDFLQIGLSEYDPLATGGSRRIHCDALRDYPSLFL